jgi:hypothetical protein
VVEVADSPRLSGAQRALLFGCAARADRLGASVLATRDGQRLKDFSARVTNVGAGGPDWKDPEERLQRLTRILGRRVAEGL